MKKRIVFALFVLLVPLICHAQNIKLQDVNVPGETSLGGINSAILGENIIGPRKVLFLGNDMYLQKEEVTNNSRSGQTTNVDVLPTFYSGRIYSPGIIEPFVFENKTPEELILMEFTVYPTILEQPYTLYVDLAIRTMTKPITSELSDDAGEYSARVIITYKEI